MEPKLRSLQGLLYRLITAPKGVASGLRAEALVASSGLESIICGDERLSGVERIGIYATAYFYRLLDCLKEDYPATLTVLGPEAFQRLIAEYVAEFPPTEPSIFYAGQHLADFIAKHPLARDWPFAADLARLERTMIEVFHGPNAEPLDPGTMRSVPPERWPAFELQIHPAAKFLDVNWKVSDVLRAVNEKREWAVPTHEHSRIIVFRQNGEVYFRELDIEEKAALERTLQPIKFADLCEKIALAIKTEQPAHEINRFFERWISDGILVAASG